MIKKFRQASRAYSNYYSILPILEPTWTIQVYIASNSMIFFTNITLLKHIKGYLYLLPNKGPTESCPQRGMKYLYASRSELIQVFSFQTLQIVIVCN